MKKFLCMLLSAVMLLGILSGCGTPKTEVPKEPAVQTVTEPAAPTEKPADADAPAAEEPATKTITDVPGRTVEVPASTTRVAALGSAARLLTYAGCAEQIVGCTELEMKGDPNMPYAYVNKERFAACSPVASGGNSNTNFMEELAVLKPDVIFYNGGTPEDLDSMQAQLEIPVVGLYSSNFYDDNFFQSLEVIGQVMGTQEHVNTVTTAIHGWIEDLDARTKDIPDSEKPTVYTGALSFSGPHGFEGTSANFPPFVAVHAKNVADESGEKGCFLVDLEKVTQWDPDFIFLNPRSMSYVNEDYKLNPDFYDNLSAVKNGNVYSMVSYNYFWSNQELAIADAYYVGSILYPEQFADVNFEEKAEEIFNTMLGCDYLDVLNENHVGFTPLTIGEG